MSPTEMSPDDLLALYNRAVPALYRVTEEAFDGLTDGAHLIPHFTQGCLTGYALLRGASLTLLVADPAHQRQGIGTSLLKQAQAWAKSRGKRRLVLGVGSDYVIQGVPTEENAHLFFEKCGFTCTGFTYDMTLCLTGFDRTPPCPEEIAFRTMPVNDAVLDAVAMVDGTWRKTYESTDEDVLCVMHGEKIAGFCIPSAFRRFCNDRETGSVSCIGVLPAYRRRGIGLAMTAHAAKLLRDDGCTRAELLYTAIPQWYEKLGFAVMHRLWMGECGM